MDLVRAGIGLYGLSPDPSVATSSELGLQPAMRLESALVQVKRIDAGQAVSYGGTWCAPTDRWVGLVPLGYSDGIPRAPAPPAPWGVGNLMTSIVGAGVHGPGGYRPRPGRGRDRRAPAGTGPGRGDRRALGSPRGI